MVYFASLISNHLALIKTHIHEIPHFSRSFEPDALHRLR
jgi:hypothetical protein